jgi:DNA polymerase
MILANDCKECGLSRTRNKIVWGEGHPSARVMFIGQDPGEMEDEHGTPFYFEAPAGMELERLLGIIGLARENVYISNSCKCHTPNNRGPSKEELDACWPFLVQEIAAIKPRVIVTMGVAATENLIGPVNMEMVHGIPFKTHIPFPEIIDGEAGIEVIVIPVYHPAAGLRSPDSALKCVLDFTAVGAVLRGKLLPSSFWDVYKGKEEYRVLESPDQVSARLARAHLLAIDTETYGDVNNTPYMVQFSAAPGQGYIVYADNTRCLEVIARHVAQPGITTIMHNSLFDLLVLEKLGIFPADVRDTMIMAYLLQSEPLGLKTLAFRHWGMEMLEYEEIIAEASADLAFDYLMRLKEYNWPMPDKVMQIKPDGTIHYKQPQNIIKVVDRMLKDYASGKIQKVGLWKRWHQLDPDETSRSFVEELLDEMPEGNLSLIDPDVRHRYAARDPDATIRIYGPLWSRLEAQDMEDVFHMDMAVVPMALDMMKRGIKPDADALRTLGIRFGAKVDELEGQIYALAGKKLNLRSPMQVADLLFNQLKLEFKFKHNKVTTNDKTMARLVAQHPVVPLIRKYRQYSKLQTTYTNKLPKWIAADGRIHTKLNLTGTATGRLCVDPETLIEAPRDMDLYPNGIPLKELKTGDYVYSFDWKRELTVRKVKWVGSTGRKRTVKIRYQAVGKNAPVLELLVSPEHLIRLYGGMWKHAGSIKPGDRLLCMVTRTDRGEGYFSFFSHSRNRANGQRGGGQIKEHRFIYSQVNKESLSSKTIIHHKDKRQHNNTPSNLQKVLSIREHQILHRMTKDEYKQAIETGLGRKGILKFSTIEAYKRRLRALEDEERGISGVNHVVLSVEPGPEMELWDLEIEDTHTFIGNEVALHNSSSKPNLMNQPTRSEDGKEIRRCFVPSEGCVFVSNDLCLPGDETVQTIHGIKRVDAIKPGELVLSTPDGITLTFEEVVATKSTGQRELCVVVLNEGIVRCTPEHRLMLLNGTFKEAKDLKPGDRLMHIHDGASGPTHRRVPTWYGKFGNRNYVNKHILVARYGLGKRPKGHHVDHLDGDVRNWRLDNLRYLPAEENYAQGGQRYWKAVKEGRRSDESRLANLRNGLRRRRDYSGEGNPNYGKRKGEPATCSSCGKTFYRPPSRKAQYCSGACYHIHKRNNHKVRALLWPSEREITYHIQVANTETFVLENGVVSHNSQIEMRMLSHESGDPLLLDIFRNNRDIHAITASNIFKLPVDQLDDMKHRYPAKRVGFGVVYGITAAGLQEQLLMIGLDPEYWTIPRCQALINEWFRLYHHVALYMQDLVAFALRHGYVEDMFGRRRYLATIHSSSRQSRAEAARQAGNMPIQCLPGSTRVLTREGYRRIGDFENATVWTGHTWAPAIRIYKGRGQLVHVETDDGMVLVCDTAHQVLVANSAWPDWKSVVDLAEGDVLAGSVTRAPGGKEYQTEEFWYWVGRYYGDGYMVHFKKGDIRPTTGKPATVYRSYVEWAFGGAKKKDVKRLRRFLVSLGFNPRIEVQRKGKSVVLRVRDYGFNKLMMQFGITPNQVAWTKRIADVVFTLSPTRRESFIKGYYDADGTTRKHYPNGWTAEQITSVNRELLQDTALLLRSVGRRAYLKGPYREDIPGHRPFFRLSIHPDPAVRKRVVRVVVTNDFDDVFTLAVEDSNHSFDSEGIISKNSGAAGVFKKGMANLTPIYKEFQARGYRIWPVLPIHDDLVFEVEEDLVDIWIPIQQDVMEHSVTLKVPIKSDAKVGRVNWGDGEKYKW